VLCVALAVWWAWPKGASPTGSVRQSAAIPEQVATVVANTRAPRLSFVVLPFENLSRDPDQEYFADGITDDLTTDLSQIPGSFVIARNSAFTYRANRST
jgi:adenylate cyclase